MGDRRDQRGLHAIGAVLMPAVTHYARASGAAGRSHSWQILFDPRDPRPVKLIVNWRSA
jgi:hypothetical protein